MTEGNRKIVAIGFAVILVLIISLMVFGIIDLSLYKANFNNGSNYFSAYSKSKGNYALEIQYQGKPIYNHLFINNNDKPIDIIVKIEDYQYKGNYYLPLVKKFTMDYKCSFLCPSLNESDANNFRGSVEGHIEAKITGMCSIRKTKLLTEEKAVEAIKNHIIATLQKLNNDSTN
jgi:hypothetical protein